MGELAAFIILSAVILIPGVIVVTSGNIVRSALSLVPTFLGVTGLTEGGSGVEVRQMNEQVPLGATAALWLAFLILLVILRTPWNLSPGRPPAYSAPAIGSAFLTNYALIFEVTSVVLLVALIGAIVIARREE